jgi:Domain of unknown function (DUF4173)
VEDPASVEPPRSAGASAAADPVPQLLVTPGGGDLPTIAWPGPAGAPAWAIPVSVPPGTRGYAIFLPLIPQQPAAAQPDTPAATGIGSRSPATPATGVNQPPADAGRSAGPQEAAAAEEPANAEGGSPTADGESVPGLGVPGPDVPGVGVPGVGVPGVGVPGAGEPELLGEAPGASEQLPADVETAPEAPAQPGASAQANQQESPASEQPAAPPSQQQSPMAQAASQQWSPVTQPVDQQQPRVAQPAGQFQSRVAQPAGQQPWPVAPPVTDPFAHAAAQGQPPVTPGHAPAIGVQPAAPWQFPVSRHLPPPTPGFLARHWPGPAQRKRWDVPLAVLAGGLGTAVFLPLGRVGIGWLLTALVIVAGVVAVVWRALADEPRGERVMRTVWAASAIALLSVLAFRNAWWLVTFSVLGALGCAALAIVGGSRVRSILFSLVAAPFAAFRGIGWVSRHLSGRSRLKADAGTRMLLSVMVTVLVLVVFGALLSSADAAFSTVLGDVAPSTSPATVFTSIFLLAVGALITTGAIHTLFAPPDLSTVDAPPARRIGALEWALPVGALVVLFAGFVAVQFTVLFGGRAHVLETAGLNYAEYARSGFWQLFTVTLLTLVVLAAAGRWARRETPRERLVLRVLLGALCALSIVIVISALQRMYTYQQVYSFTGERVFVMGFEIMLGVVFLLVLVAGIRLRGGWVPRASVGLAVVLLLTLAVMNPEDYVARRNIARYQQEGKIDAWYLRALSADATPALSELPDPVRRCVLSWIAGDLDDDDPWYAWNLDRQRARDVLDQLGPEAIGNPADCQRADQFDFPKTR